MKKQNKIKVLNVNGEEIEAEVLLYFNLDKTGKDYILYTLGEIDKQGMETIHASVLKQQGDSYTLDTMDDDEWNTVKDVMREIIRNEGE